MVLLGEECVMAKAGRPKQDIIRDKIISIRMLQEEYDEIKSYADSTNKTVTEVMMDGAKKLMEEDKNK